MLEAGEELTDLETAKEQRWAVQRGTVEADFLDDVVRPDDEPILFDDVVACVDAVADGRADAALVDLSTALILTKGRADVTTGGRFIDRRRDGRRAAARQRQRRGRRRRAPRPSRATARSTTSSSEFLAPVFETDPSSIPVIRTPS